MSDKPYNLLVPMAGLGKRFQDEGYPLPKQVLVAGEVVYTGSAGTTGARPGRLLRRQSLPQAPMAGATFGGPQL